MKHFKLLTLTAVAVGVSLVATGCSRSMITMRHETAQRLAAPVWMNKRIVPAGIFSLTAYERVRAEGQAANLYIEGDGVAWLSKTRVSLDPTPKKPTALHLATRDQGDNVIWMARPCQYSKLRESGKACDSAYWTNKRYAPEVLEAYNAALDNMKAKYGITGFNLVGFSGGGTVAALLAAQRPDVVTLRTVAGNLDHKAHSDYHNVSYLKGSLNPVDYAANLGRVPQKHFIGGYDKIVPQPIFESYAKRVGGACIGSKVIKANHEEGWVPVWSALLKETVPCAAQAAAPVAEVKAAPAPMAEAPVRITRESAMKP